MGKNTACSKAKISHRSLAQRKGLQKKRINVAILRIFKQR